MTADDIIKKFEQYTGDTTELSSQQELDLVNKIYIEILTNRVWNFLLSAGTGTITNNVAPLPDDFFYMPIISYETDTGTYGSDKVVFVGPNYQPYKVINFTDRLKYKNQSGYVYIDLKNKQFVFTDTPTSTDIYFTYVYKPELLELNDEPIFPDFYHDAIYHGMIQDDMICQLFDKARSYAQENNAKYKSKVDDLTWYDTQSYAQ